MKKVCFLASLTAATLIGTTLTVAPAQASGACADMPSVSWWGNLTHASTVGYVERTHGGNWSQYLAKWVKYESRMKDVQKRGAIAVVRSIGKRLQGTELDDYIGKISQRVSVIRCLASTVPSNEAVRFNDLPTAAGEDAPSNPLTVLRPKTATAPVNKQSFAVSDGRMNFTVTTMCAGNEAVFVVRNNDNRGRTPSNFSLYSKDGGQALSSRRMWLGPGQSVRFGVNTGDEKNDAGRAILRIQPVAARAAHYDATVDCNASIQVNRSSKPAANRS